jgi:hypothetical protein
MCPDAAEPSSNKAPGFLRYKRSGCHCRRKTTMPGNARSYLRPSAIERIFGRILVSLILIGLIRGHFYILEVRGRKTGRTISLPVDPLDIGGQRYLVCARGNSNWVRNARTAGEVVLLRAMRRRRYALRELPLTMRPPILKAYLDRYAIEVQRASSPYRKDRRWNPSMNSHPVTRSSSSSHWTTPRPAPERLRNENKARSPACALSLPDHRPTSRLPPQRPPVTVRRREFRYREQAECKPALARRTLARSGRYGARRRPQRGLTDNPRQTCCLRCVN